MRALVIGGGLAGTCAALELRAAGAFVVLCHVGSGATASCGGPLDIAPASTLVGEVAPLVDGRLETPAARLERVRARFPNHPYTTFFAGQPPDQLRAQIVGAVARLNEWLGPESLRVDGSFDASALFVGIDGSLRAGDFALSSVAAGDLATAPAAALAAFPALISWRAAAAETTLRASLESVGRSELALTLVEPEWPATWIDAATEPARLAARLDDDGGAETFLEALRPFLHTERPLLIPPLLGLDAGKGCEARVLGASEHPIAELVATAPASSVGVRLDRGLRAALHRAGVEVRDHAVVPFEAPNDGLRTAQFASGERESFDAFVIATGRFSSGGLVLRDGYVAEALLKLPLYDASGARADALPARQQTRPRYDEGQPLYSSGIRVDAHCRPLGDDGRPRYSNLFAAGDLIGGFDPARDRTGYGVALVSGLLAGRRASKCKSEGA